jgi:hypothetical protein
MNGSLVNPETGRLSVQTVERLHRLLAGDPATEQAIMDFIQARWQARDLFDIPERVAREIINRPTDFIRAAKEHQRNAKRGIAAKKRKEPKGFNHR